MNRPIHFEIPAEKPERAIQFYEKVFGWKFERWNGPMEYWNISTGDSQTWNQRRSDDTTRSGAAMREYDGCCGPGCDERRD